MTLTNFWWLLIWMFTGGLFLAVFFPKRKEIVMGKTEVRWGVLPAILMVVPYIVWAGFRSDAYGDTYAYRTAFWQTSGSIRKIAETVSEASKDKGFTVLTVILKRLVGNSDVVYFLIIAVIQMLIIALVFRKYSCNYWLSMFFFVASTDYISWMHNGIRQFIAVTMIFAATELLVKKKYIPLILIILLASTIHGSALLMIPVVFIIQGKALNKRTILCVFGVVLALAFVDRFTDILDTVLADTQYTNVVSDWQTMGDDGTSPLRALVYSVPAIMAIVGLKYVRNEDNPIINISVNASVISASLMWLSTATSGIFLGRLPIFVELYAIGIALPWLIKNTFNRDSAQFITVMAIVCYVGFFYYQMHFSWGLM